ncbi:hypothetical protein [Streptomyces sp. NRRL S-340]|uniref:hypothetical protein n=1 Tax=Streptomyces sp. NRRL S-340 TaxID=1463901 RepID=UPI00131B6E69|nr:hypothetical protein [Streptomyces sp. NRRL S-340]
MTGTASDEEKNNLVDSASWKSSVLELYGGGWTFAAVGPREHEDWRRDTAAVMALKTTDPRKWLSINYAPEVGENRSGTGSPFMPWSPEQIGESLYEISAGSAAQLLVALKGEFYQAAGIPDFERHKDSLFASSRNILARFPSDTVFLTNAADAYENRDADLLNPDTEWSCLSVYTTDCGLVAVSDTEVGVFWAFWED